MSWSDRTDDPLPERHPQRPSRVDDLARTLARAVVGPVRNIIARWPRTSRPSKR